jgi:nicotinate-nucleotide adenylyltransferase
MALTPFLHRYAMVALACADHATFVPSVAEAEMDGATPRVFYTIDTVRRFRREHPDDHLYFIVGADQFLELPTWKNYEALLDCCDFIIASRPGFKLDALRLVIPPEKLGVDGSPANPGKIALRKSSIYMLTTVSSHVSSTEIRNRLDEHKGIHGLVPPRVEEYILGQALYR